MNSALPPQELLSIASVMGCEVSFDPKAYSNKVVICSASFSNTSHGTQADTRDGIHLRMNGTSLCLQRGHSHLMFGIRDKMCYGVGRTTHNLMNSHHFGYLCYLGVEGRERGWSVMSQ